MNELNEQGAAWAGEPKQSVADQIRALNRAGYPRAEIARRLGKRYQHVRNVLEGDKTRSAPRDAPQVQSGVDFFLDPERPRYFRIEVTPDGRLTLPEPVRAALNVAGCGVVVGRLDGPDLTLTDALTSAQRARERVRALNPSGESVVDSLIADRRREAAREADD